MFLSDLAAELYPNDVLMCQNMPFGSRKCIAGLWKGSSREELERGVDIQHAVALGMPRDLPGDAMQELKLVLREQVESERQLKRRRQQRKDKLNKLERDTDQYASTFRFPYSDIPSSFAFS